MDQQNKIIMKAIYAFLAGLTAIILYIIAVVLHCVNETSTAFYFLIAGTILFIYFIKFQNQNGKF